MDAEALLWHRELQFLRAAGNRRIPRRARSRYIAERAKKLREAEKIVARKRNVKSGR